MSRPLYSVIPTDDAELAVRGVAVRSDQPAEEVNNGQVNHAGNGENLRPVLAIDQ